jgi:ATP-binding cassette subfamily E protein 1
LVISNTKDHLYKYPAMMKSLGNFKLRVEEGSFTNSEIVVLLGENGSGKTTLIRMLTGDPKMAPDEKNYEVFVLIY